MCYQPSGSGDPVIDIVTIATPGLGNRSYVVHDRDSAVVIDPPRDIDRVMRVLDDRGLRPTNVLETHVHNDYVSGGLELSARTGARYALAADEELAFARHPVRDGDSLTSGSMTFRAMHTPGHTPHHFAYVLRDDDRPLAVFTGGSLLYGAVGRTDLIDASLTVSLTRAQFRSARRLADELPSTVAVYPTHGFGSFCASGEASDADASTLGDERRHNPALTTDDEDAFVAHVVRGLGAYPRYYAHVGPINRSGPSPVDLRPPRRLTPHQLQARIHAGDWVVDIRTRTAFAATHLAGTVNVELGDSLATYVGWTIPWAMPVTLVGDTSDDVAEAQRMIARIGIDRPAGRATGGPAAFGAGGDLRAYEVGEFADLAAALSNGGAHVLDVRRDDEWRDGHIAGAHHIPLPDLQARIAEVPDSGQTWVHCASGYRAAIAASLLDRAGKPVVLINDDWDDAPRTGLPVTS
jgi:glyoxylase-like metal-dependent hydrolase (beta-lactamase superfamily II)/rhodanese-related sulfurtransferase